MSKYANIDELNKTISELENTSNEMKAINEALKSIDELYHEVSAASDSFIEMDKGLNNITNKVGETLKNLNISIESIKNENTNNHRIIQELIKNGLSDFENKIEILKQENTKLYRDTQDSVYKAMGKNRSDIQVDVRNEGLQIERAFENSLNKNFLALEGSLKDKFNDVDNKINKLIEDSKKSQNYLRIIMGVNAVITIVLIIFIIIR